MKLEFYGHIFESYPNIKFHENLSSGSQVVPRERTYGQTDIKTDMTKLTAFCSSVKVSQKCEQLLLSLCVILLFESCSAKFLIVSHYTEFKNKHPFPKPSSLNNNFVDC